LQAWLISQAFLFHQTQSEETMKPQRFSYLLRTIMVIAILGMLTSLSGGTPTPATPKQSYIVQAATTVLAAQLVESHGGTVTSRLDIIHAVGALLSDQGVAQLRLEKGIIAITPNGSVESSDNDTPGENDRDRNKEKEKNKGVPSTDYPNVIGADFVWQDGVNGSGVTVAVLDTGLGNLAGLKKDADNKPGRIVAWIDFIEESHKPIDPNGHGSHVAGIIANSQKGADGEWNGVAPGVKLAGVRVLDENGVGTYETVILGLQWVLENQARYNIRIVNLSLVALVQSPYWADPLNQAVTQVWADGITVIVAAGNTGPAAMSITVPGNNPYVITVGAYTDNFTPADWNDDYIPPFSSAGPTLDGFVKPDVVAPGAHMVSLVPADSVLTEQYPENKLNSNYFKLAGTSQATAVVSGTAALIIANDPGLTPNEVKMRLTGTALPWVDINTTNALYSMWEQGAGAVNAPDAVFADVSGIANEGMDIQADLAGITHYEGYSYYDETTSTYRLYDPYSDWDGGYGTWNGARGTWAGARGTWAGEYGAWAGARGTWAGARGTWAGALGTWTGARGTWAGARGTWAGGYTIWTGARGTWAGARGTWAGLVFAEPAFIANFAAGTSPDAATAIATISYFLQDP
jgi:serine protease AprX